MTLRIGAAGWSIPRDYAERFPDSGSHLERYSAIFNAVEINTSFKTNHRPDTYGRWAATVPDDFAFSVKCSREITHDRRLVDVEEPLADLLEGARELGGKLGPLLVQTPPSLHWDGEIVGAFLDTLRARFDGRVVVEPRHESWFDPAVDRFLEARHVARVAADPPRVEGADAPGGWPELRYHRLHGRPRTYRSAYTREFIGQLAEEIRGLRPGETACWVIFDNTAEGHAVANAIQLMRDLALT